MTLVEKMARAIDSACECRNCGLLTYWENHSQECCDRPSWISASDRNKAIAALKAMRSPDDEEGGHIESAGMFALPFDKIYDGEPYKQANSALLCWQAMIDQAIKEGGG